MVYGKRNGDFYKDRRVMKKVRKYKKNQATKRRRRSGGGSGYGTRYDDWNEMVNGISF